MSEVHEDPKAEVNNETGEIRQIPFGRKAAVEAAYPGGLGTSEEDASNAELPVYDADVEITESVSSAPKSVFAPDDTEDVLDAMEDVYGPVESIEHVPGLQSGEAYEYFFTQDEVLDLAVEAVTELVNVYKERYAAEELKKAGDRSYMSALMWGIGQLENLAKAIAFIPASETRVIE